MKLDQTLSESDWQEIRDRRWMWQINNMGKVRLSDPGEAVAASGKTICEAFHALKNALKLK